MKGELLVSREKKNISSKMGKRVSDWLVTGEFLIGVDSVIHLSYISFLPSCWSLKRIQQIR